MADLKQVLRPNAMIDVTCKSYATVTCLNSGGEEEAINAARRSVFTRMTTKKNNLKLRRVSINTE